MLKSNNPNLKSWVEVQVDSDFPIQNLPFGVFSNGAIIFFYSYLFYLHSPTLYSERDQDEFS